MYRFFYYLTMHVAKYNILLSIIIHKLHVRVDIETKENGIFQEFCLSSL